MKVQYSSRILSRWAPMLPSSKASVASVDYQFSTVFHQGDPNNYVKTVQRGWFDTKKSVLTRLQR